MQCISIGLLLATCAVGRVDAQHGHIGHVTFPNTGAAAAQEPFLRGVALLHSYECTEAREAFAAARSADPNFALAWWFEAMTFSQFDWGIEDLPGAQATLRRLGSTRQERLHKRRVRVSGCSGRQSRRFLSTALNVIVQLASLQTCARGQTKLRRRWKLWPSSRGRRSTFCATPRRLTASNAQRRRAWAASRASARLQSRGVADLGWHSLQWLQYAYLQQGRYRAAYALLDSARALLDPASSASMRGYPDVKYVRALLAFQYGAETGDWARTFRDGRDEALQLDSLEVVSPRERQQAVNAAYQVSVARLFARSDTVRSVQIVDVLRRTQERVARTTPLHSVIGEMVAQLTALSLRVRGSREAGIATLQGAIPPEDALPTAPLGPPTIVPTLEVLGQQLLDDGQPAAARAVLQRALAERPNRGLALLALARTEAALGNSAAALEAYRQLELNWHGADSEVRVVLDRARQAIRR